MVRINASTELYGVFGNPVRHSKSPILHNGWINDFGINAVYLAFEPKIEDFETCFLGLVKAGLKGANFTTPFKEKAALVATEKNDIVMNINAANTIKIDEKGIYASIGDGEGLLLDLEIRAKDKLQKTKTVSVLGAGGAAKAVVCELLRRDFENINIIARNPKKIDQFISEISALFDTSRVQGIEWDNMANTIENSQLIINATSLGLAGNGEIDFDFSKSSKDALVYDMIYYPKETKFLENARLSGLMTLNGIGMLVGQAAISFETWFGIKPDFRLGLERILNND